FLALRDTREEMYAGLRGCTEAWALMLARTLRDRCDSTWAIGETGAAGPAGNRYGDPSGVSWVAVDGPVERPSKTETGSNARVAPMRASWAAALKVFAEVSGEKSLMSNSIAGVWKLRSSRRRYVDTGEVRTDMLPQAYILYTPQGFMMSITVEGNRK